MLPEKRSYIVRLLIAKWQGNLTPAEEAELTLWASLHPANQETLEYVSDFYGVLKDLLVYDHIQMKKPL